MKLPLIAAAFGVLIVGAVPATAQHTVVTKRTVVHRDGPVRHVRTRRVCRVEVRHHHRVRTCRTVRY